MEKWLLGLDSLVDLPIQTGITGGSVVFVSSPIPISCVFSFVASWRFGKSRITISSYKTANDEAWPTGCSFQSCLLPVDREPKGILFGCPREQGLRLGSP